MGFVSHGNIFVHKDDAQNEDDDDDEDAHMVKLVNVVDPSEIGPSNVPLSSSLSIEDQIAYLTRQMKQMSTLQQSRHEELMELQWSHHTTRKGLLDD